MKKTAGWGSPASDSPLGWAPGGPRTVLLVLSLCAIRGASAGELGVFGGGLISDRSGATTYTWGIEYRDPISEHWSGSFIWLNEGHLPNNHRDGQAAQLWWHTLPGPMGVSFEFGLGPYVDYDTHVTREDPNSEDRHGVGGLASADMRWDFARNWSTYLRFNEVDTTAKHVSSGIATGVVYVFGPDLAALAAQQAGNPPPRWELSALFGERVVNSFQSEGGGAEAIDAHFRVSEHIGASATLVTGQDTSLNWRDGLAVQLWLEQQLSTRLRAAVGAGGFFVAGDSSLHSSGDTPENVSSAISVTIAYYFTPRWLARIMWTRLGTGDDLDCDLMMAGAGFSF